MNPRKCKHCDCGCNNKDNEGRLPAALSLAAVMLVGAAIWFLLFLCIIHFL